MIDLEQLYHEHGQTLFGFVWNWTRSDADTQDVLQEVFERLALQPTLIAALESPKAYLVQMARSCLIDRQRRADRRVGRERRSAAEERQFMEAADPDRMLLRRSLEQALGGLPEVQRSVVYLKLWEEFTFQQIAECLDILPNTAASRYRLGLAKLRDTLRPLYEEIQP